MSKIVLFLLFAILISGATLFYIKKNSSEFYSDKNQHHMFVIAQAHTLVGFDLIDPEEAPSDIRESVMRGYRLIMNTPFYAPNYARDQLSCTNCHFAEGDTLGGKNNGISLVGVTNVYPSYSTREKKIISLADRINNCFERSLSGRPLPKDSQEMQDIIAYLSWISKEVKTIKNIPWLGLTLLKSDHEPDADQGKKLYQTYCAACHKEDGQGGGVLMNTQGKTIPPVWGPNSFNTGAGMNNLPILAAFIYWNMPYGEAITLTEEEAIDIASFVSEQSRPSFTIKSD